MTMPPDARGHGGESCEVSREFQEEVLYLDSADLSNSTVGRLLEGMRIGG
jgi:hypothetical protein